MEWQNFLEKPKYKILCPSSHSFLVREFPREKPCAAHPHQVGWKCARGGWRQQQAEAASARTQVGAGASIARSAPCRHLRESAGYCGYWIGVTCPRLVSCGDLAPAPESGSGTWRAGTWQAALFSTWLAAGTRLHWCWQELAWKNLWLMWPKEAEAKECQWTSYIFNTRAPPSWCFCKEKSEVTIPTRPKQNWAMIVGEQEN